MTEPAIIDAGPLVALLEPKEEHHRWAADVLHRVRAPLLTCEPVLAEAFHLLRKSPRSEDALFDWLARGSLIVAFELSDEFAAVHRLMKKYPDVPMSLADACIVRMAETFDDHAVCTLDGDFHVYRKHGSKELRLIAPGRG